MKAHVNNHLNDSSVRPNVSVGRTATNSMGKSFSCDSSGSSA